MNPDHSSIRSLEAKNPPPRGRTATDGTRAANEPKRIETPGHSHDTNDADADLDARHVNALAGPADSDEVMQ